jgi:hypothetical protein
LAPLPFPVAGEKAVRLTIGSDDILTRSDALLVSCEGGVGVLLFVKPLANQLLEQIQLAIEYRLPLGRCDRL